ncbi:MAG TPA: serine/threonine-protein kinase [Pyrinomonadaceae bacterium]|nr:serine/threonine-protein kinase [Pyrinomonadaceae bacterium]
MAIPLGSLGQLGQLGTEVDEAATQRFDSRQTPTNKPGSQYQARVQSQRGSHSHSQSQSYDSIDNARFVPGAILVDRYRIVGLLGKGGMGEVYRADDLKLGQPVALKFLPDHLLSDGAALARFHREVRVARQVTHKNVCRMYDIGETDGRHFLSMEYIKGEELSSLLRRIGRLPVDKSIQLARQICAGLNAAHDIGVLHRDLKPANVMIDADGNARILDFGLAGLSEELPDNELIAGTPAYMAPEQLAGTEQTVKTDIYSLGLVLYELFTSKKAFEASTLHELMELRRNNTAPTSLTSLVDDLDPVIERVIDRCIQTDPALRPSSALQVSAALPGGDPIAAALAAGETPSPEMVAAAPKQGILSPAVAGGLFAAFVLLLALTAWLTKYTAPYRLSPTGDSPEVLRARARDVIKDLGYAEPSIDYADGVNLLPDLVNYIADNDQSPHRWQKLGNNAAGAYRYWYRQSPRYFETTDPITVDHPALEVSGMISLYLDTSGKLHWFTAVPPQRDTPTTERIAADWSIPFRSADLDMKNFQAVTATWVPLHAYDERAAWDGTDSLQNKIHVEAAAFKGKLVYFETIYPWDLSLRQEQPRESGGNKALTIMVLIVSLLALFGSSLLARRNLRLGRGDRRGATRLAVAYATVRMLVWLFAEHHNGLVGRETSMFFQDLAFAIFSGTFLWLLYVAFEPFLRKTWPGWGISWSRLLAGDYRDPLVGRDLLIGLVFGVAMSVLQLLSTLVPNWFGKATPLFVTPAATFLGPNAFFARFESQVSAGLFIAFVCVFLLLLFLRLLRREMPALITVWVILTVFATLISQSSLIMVPLIAITAFLAIFVMRRYGLLALTTAAVIAHLLIFFPVTTDLSAWYATDFTIALAICLGLGGYAAYTSLGGRTWHIKDEG